MPSSDLILNVRQIANYQVVGGAGSADAILMQRGGLGGPYVWINPEDLVSTALSAGGDMTIGGNLSAFSMSGGSLGFSNGVINLLSSNTVTVANLQAAAGTIAGVPIATKNDVTNALLETVRSFNFRRGDVWLMLEDVTGAGGAPIVSPVFVGIPQAPTPALDSNDSSIATTAFVQQGIGAYFNYWIQNQPLVFSFNGRSGDVTLQASDITAAGLAPLDSPAFTGVPTAPTAAKGTDTNQIATTAFVTNALATFDLSQYAPLNSPSFSGQPTAPTAPPGASDGRVATTAFVHAAVVAATTGVSSFNTRTGAVVLTTADITGAGGAVLASPVFTGSPAAPTAAPGTNTTQIATTQFVTAALTAGAVTSFNTRTGAVTLSTADITGAGGAVLASPHFTGIPTAPTATAGDSSTTLATTAFVASAIAGVGGVVNSFNGRSGAVTLAANDISAAGGAVLASPSFSGTPTAPTATAGTATSQIATTSFVMAALAGGAGVSSFNGRTGAITLTTADVTGAGGAPLASPNFTGNPSGPTAAVATSTTQLATTAFVQAAIGAGAVSSFNTRQGAVTLNATDITNAGGAVLASPTFTGVPQAPTAAPGVNTQQIATTAFVQAAVSAASAGVISFNGRQGAVTLMTNDISAAGGAVLASPVFTGTPTAPTPATADSSTTIATTAFVKAAIGGPYLPLTGGTITGTLGLTGPGSTQLSLNKATGAFQNLIYGMTNGVGRWQLVLGNSVAESGSNTGSDFGLNRCDNTGAIIDTPLVIPRATGIAQFLNDLVVNATAGQPTHSIAYNGVEKAQFYYNTASGNTGLYHLLSGQTAGMLNNGMFNVTGSVAYKPGGGAWTDSSDERIKTVMGDYKGGLKEILGLLPVDFVFKGNDAFSEGAASPHAGFAKEGRRLVGLVAQQVEKVMPSMVSRREGWLDGKKVADVRDLDPSELIYALINAVKELSTRLEKLEAIT